MDRDSRAVATRAQNRHLRAQSTSAALSSPAQTNAYPEQHPLWKADLEIVHASCIAMNLTFSQILLAVIIVPKQIQFEKLTTMRPRPSRDLDNSCSPTDILAHYLRVANSSETVHSISTTPIADVALMTLSTSFRWVS